MNPLRKWLYQPSKLDPEFTRRDIYVLRWRIWKTKWFPYRTYTLDLEKLDLEKPGDLTISDIYWGPAKWNRPDVLRRK